MNCGECRWYGTPSDPDREHCSVCGVRRCASDPACPPVIALAEAALARRDAAIALALAELDNLRTPGLSYLASVVEAARVLREATEKEVVP